MQQSNVAPRNTQSQNRTRRRWLATMAAALLASAGMAMQEAEAACANVRIVVPFPAGGPADQLARTLSHGLQQRHANIPYIVDNKPGANGQ